MTDDVVGVKAEKPLHQKKAPKPKAQDDCYWIIDGRDYKRTMDVYPCIYRAQSHEDNS